MQVKFFARQVAPNGHGWQKSLLAIGLKFDTPHGTQPLPVAFNPNPAEQVNADALQLAPCGQAVQALLDAVDLYDVTPHATQPLALAFSP